MRITMLENEYWWGGIVNLGETLPYDKDSDCDLFYHLQNSDHDSI